MKCVCFMRVFTILKGEYRTTGRLIWVKKRFLGLVPYKHYFAEGSEIAAHVFAGEMMDLPFSTYEFVDEAAKLWKKVRKSRPVIEYFEERTDSDVVVCRNGTEGFAAAVALDVAGARTSLR